MNNTCTCSCFVDPDLSWVGAIAFLILIIIAVVWYYSKRINKYKIIPPEDRAATVPINEDEKILDA